MGYKKNKASGAFDGVVFVTVQYYNSMCGVWELKMMRILGKMPGINILPTA